LRKYQEERQTTILLTSHYMKDVAALCQRVVIIAQGQIRYDGSLAGIIDRFSGHKLVTLQFGGETMPDDLDRFGEVMEVVPPRASIRIERSEVAKALSTLLDRHTIEDVSVEDPPLEEVIADLFSQVDHDDETAEVVETA
jgi:ABC-2 type transport system ATP-binding protein